MTTPDSERRVGPPTNPYEPPKAPINPPVHKPAGGLEGRSPTARRPASGAQFSLKCQCGQTVTVAASEAGSTVECLCGAEVKVPSLGRLREMVGKDPYESGPADMIRRMVQTGELPAGRTCAHSRKPTDDVLDFEILVPRSFQRPQGLDKLISNFWLFGIMGQIYMTLFRPPKIEEAGAVRVRAPLRVSARYHAKVRRMSQRRLKKLLRTVPVYAKLLEESAFTKVSVAEEAA
jgi:hypothetical protein